MKRNINSKIGLGTAAIGRPKYINLKTEKRSNAKFSLETFRAAGRAIIESAYVQGVRYFDTAPGYGLAEELLTDWLTDNADPNIEVASKWGYTYVANYDPTAVKHEVKEHSLIKLNEQWESSKLLLPKMTTYQIHSASFETGVLNNDAVLNRLAELKDEYDLHIGLSTTGSNQVELLKKANDLEVDGKELFDVFQVTYNIFDQSLATIAKEISNRNKRLVIKEAMANGRIFINEKYPHYRIAQELLQSLASKHKVGVDAIALRFCIDSIPSFKVLSGAATEQHISENLKALDFSLEEKDIDLLKILAIRPELYWDERKRLVWN